MPHKSILAVCFLISLYNVCFAQQPKLMLPIGHTKYINSAQFSPDGKRIVTASIDKTAKIWDVASGNLLLNLKGNSGDVTSAQYSRDGKSILTASDSTVKIWDAETGKVLKEIKDSSAGPIIYAQLSPDGKRILALSLVDSVKIWDAETGKFLFKLDAKKDYVHSVQYSPDGKSIMTASDSTVKIWDAETGDFLFEINGIKDRFRSAQYSPDGEKILTISINDYAKIWDAETGKFLFEINETKGGFRYTQYNPDGKKFPILSVDNSVLILDVSPDKFLTLGLDNNVSIWDVNTGKLSAVLRGHTSGVETLQFSPDGNKIISSGFSDYNKPATCWVWDVVSGKLSPPIKTDTATYNIVLYSPDSKKVVTTTVIYSGEESRPEDVKIWDVASGKLISKLKDADFFKGMVGFSPDGKKILTVSEGFTSPIIWEVNTGKQLVKLNSQYSRINSVQFSKDGKKIMTTSLEGSIQEFKLKIWDAATGKVLKKFSDFNGGWVDAQISPDGKKMITAAIGKGPRIWDFTTYKPLFYLKGSGYVTFFEYSPDGNKIVTASYDTSIKSYDYTIKIWNALTGKLLVTANGFVKGLSAVHFSPDSKKILATSFLDEENNVKVWDAANGNLLNELRGHNDIVNYAIFSPDGKSIATASQDNTIKKWDVATGKCLYTFFAVEKDDYLVVDNNNHFDGTKAAINLLYFTCGTEIVDLRQAKETLYIPGLAKLINNGEIINTKTLGELDLCGLTPEVDVTTSNTGDFIFEIKPRRGGLGTTELFINGKMLSAYQPGDLDKSGDNLELKIKKEKLTPYLPDPINIVSVKAYTDADHNSVPSREANISVDKSGPPAPPPNLYAVMVGVSDYKSADMQLNYAAIDANDMSNAVADAAKKLLGNDHVFMYNLTTAEKHDLLPYKKNIKQVFDSIGSKAAANDILLIFLSGHGVTRKKDNQFYYMTAEASSLEEESISSDFGISTEELTDWMKLENIKAQKRILIMDACYSGQAINNFITLGSGNPGFLASKGDDNWQQKKAIETLNDNSGMIILSASSSAQLSWESKAYSHGYLTYSLLLAIKQSIPGNTLDVSEWFSAAKKTVIEVSKKWGAPQEPQFIPSTNFPIGMVDKDVMANIKLAEEKQLFIPSNFQNDDTTADGDNLLLGQKIDEALNKISSTVADSKIVFLLASSSAEACMLSGRYAVKGNIVTVRVSIKKNNLRKFRFEEKGTTDKLPDLAKRIVEKAAEWVGADK